ncbi:MAG: DUF2383 domain-containing protein [Candidatus Saccharibacteria bacterium]|nr:DUF2383 domain-containing protein [Pseudorhodobacter sp.]
MNDQLQKSQGLDELTALHGLTLDNLAGFDTMVEKSEPEFRKTTQAFQALHSRHAAILAKMLTRFARDPEKDGSLMGTVNRVVVSLRSLVDDIDQDTMKNIRTGEQFVLDAFDTAIASDLPTDVVGQLVALKAELTALLAASS